MATKKVRVEDEDRISNLPDDIICHILSFLRTKQAARTSILSSRWRYLFASVSNLDFELDHMFFHRHKRRKSLAMKSFENFVDRVLSLHGKTRIEKFRLSLWRSIDSSNFHGWLSTPLCLGVQHLHLCVYNDQRRITMLPGILFTCTTLVTLKLDIDQLVLNVPDGVCLPNLKTLHMRKIQFLNDDSVERLFSSCISLEDMHIKNCNLKNINNFKICHPLLKSLTILWNYTCSNYLNYGILIDAPSLVCFIYRDFLTAGYYSLLNLQSLVKADICISRGNSRESYRQAATAFFRGINNVQSLDLSVSSLEMLLFYDPIPLFPNMVQLKIGGCRSGKLKKGIANIFSASPKLEKVSFYEHVFSFSCLPEEVPFCLLFEMKEIEMSEFTVQKDCIRKAKYFLENAGALEKLKIHTKFSEKQKSKVTERILGLPRKSMQCRILID